MEMRAQEALGWTRVRVERGPGSVEPGRRALERIGKEPYRRTGGGKFPLMEDARAPRVNIHEGAWPCWNLREPDVGAVKRRRVAGGAGEMVEEF